MITNENTIYRQNFADEIQHTIGMAQTHPFVQRVGTGKNAHVNIILYMEKQLKDIERFCCCGATVLGVDKTFNLARMYATVTVFKHLGVENIKTKKNPIFMGPILLHHKSDVETFSYFFQHIRSRLNNCDNLFIGSDDEVALHTAVVRSFPEARHILCCKHLEENLVARLRDKVGASIDLRKNVVAMVWNILKSSNGEEFDSSVRQVIEFCHYHCSGITGYLRDRIFPLLREKVWRVKFSHWTNNNNESINHALKSKTNWQVKKIPELIELIYESVTSSYSDIISAIQKTGPYKLANGFQMHYTNPTDWADMSPEDREKAIEAYFKQSVPNSGTPTSKASFKATIVSSDEKLILAKPPERAGRKPGQSSRSKTKKRLRFH